MTLTRLLTPALIGVALVLLSQWPGADALWARVGEAGPAVWVGGALGLLASHGLRALRLHAEWAGRAGVGRVECLRVALLRPLAAHEVRQDIRAYALNAASRALLEGLRAWPEGTATTPVRAMDIGEHGHTGRLHFDASAAGGEPLAWIVDVPALEQRLADADFIIWYIRAVESAARSTLKRKTLSQTPMPSRAKAGAHASTETSAKTRTAPMTTGRSRVVKVIQAVSAISGRERALPRPTASAS